MNDLEAEVARLRVRVLSAAGDDLCRLSQEEIKQYTSGAVQIPPKEEFIASCERFHKQIADSAGVLPNCVTLAQMIAENERLRIENERLKKSDVVQADRWSEVTRILDDQSWASRMNQLDALRIAMKEWPPTVSELQAQDVIDYLRARIAELEANR